jgi:hypothetical protein
MQIREGICMPQVTDESCPAGTRAALTVDHCVPVGWQGCAAPFVPAQDGWGCEAVIVSQGCFGATRPAIGHDVCIPVGDCDEDFPPPDATHFVNGNFAAEDLDATHFSTVKAAVEAASQGALIAVYPGIYRGGFTVPTDLSVVGQCPELVILEPEITADDGILVSTVEASFRGVTITDFRIGILAEYGATLKVEDCIVEGALRRGLAALDPGTRLEAKNTLVRQVTAVPGTEVSTGIHIARGAEGVLEKVAVERNSAAGINVEDWGSRLWAVEVVGVDTVHGENTPDLAEAAAPALRVHLEGWADVSRSIFARNQIQGLTLEGGATALIEDVQITKTRTTGNAAPLAGLWARGIGTRVEAKRIQVDKNAGFGAVVLARAHLQVEDSTFSGTVNGPFNPWAVGLSVEDSGTASVSNCAFVKNTGPGLSEIGDFILADEGLRDGTYVLLQDSVVSQNGSSFKWGNAAVVLDQGVEMLAHRSTFADNRGAGFALTRHALLRLDDVLVMETRRQSTSDSEGVGLYAWEDSEAHIQRTVFYQNDGPALAVASGRIGIEHSFIVKNRMGIAVQGESEIQEVEELPDVTPANQVLITTDTVFFDNESRFGLSNIPLPE